MQLTLEQARAERDAAIASVMAHADRETPDWSENAYQFIRLYARKADKPFIGNDIVCNAEAWGLTMPDDNRAWGGPIKRAIKEGVIVRVGYVPAVHRHCAPVPLYRAA